MRSSLAPACVERVAANRARNGTHRDTRTYTRTQAVYVEYTAGEFPLGVGVPVFFDDFVDYVKGDDCFDLWGDDDVAEAVGRPPPCARGGGAVRSLRACRQLYRG